MNITFNELRKLKDSLPDGSMAQIAEKLEISVETVRNHFGGANYKKGESAGLHFEPGPDGGIVHVDNPQIIEIARQMLAEQEENALNN